MSAGGTLNGLINECTSFTLFYDAHLYHKCLRIKYNEKIALEVT